MQGTFAFRTVPATLRLDDTSAALNTAVEVGIVRVDADAYRRHAMDTLKQTGELLPGCVQQGEREHFAVRFGKDSSSNADEWQRHGGDSVPHHYATEWERCRSSRNP